MRSSSEASLNAARSALEHLIADGSSDIISIADDFFSLADLVKEDARLSRALTDPARSAEDKIALAHAAFSGSIADIALKVVNVLAGGHWSRIQDLRESCEVLGIYAVFEDALAKGMLSQVQDELFSVMNILTKNRPLRVALSTMGTADAEDRAEVANDVFAGAVSGWTLRLLHRCVSRSSHGRLLMNLRRFQEHASNLQKKRLVTLVSAASLRDDQVQRLERVISRRLHARILLNVSVDKSVLGGFRFLSGNDALDATLSSRFDKLRRSFAH